MWDINKEKVENVVKSMPTNKALGPNGFTIEFFQVRWSFLGKEIHALVEESERLRYIHPYLNSILQGFSFKII